MPFTLEETVVSPPGAPVIMTRADVPQYVQIAIDANAARARFDAESITRRLRDVKPGTVMRILYRVFPQSRRTP
jgi:hypothetical protein